LALDSNETQDFDENYQVFWQQNTKTSGKCLKPSLFIYGFFFKNKISQHVCHDVRPLL
jgi:hypothetical protein